MESCTLYDYIDNAINQFPFISDEKIGLYSPICTAEFQNLLKEHLYLNHGEMYVQPRFTMRVNNYNSLSSLIKSACTNLYERKQYEYERLYATTQLEYNPIENYNMKENGTDLKNGSVENTNSTTETLNKGATTYSETNVTGSSSATSNMGEVTTTTTDSANTNSENATNKFINGFNSTESVPSENSTSTDKNTSSGESSSVTSPHTITNSNSERTDSKNVEEGARVDSKTLSGNDSSIVNDTLTHNLTRTGNIGVTTSQQMIESERQVALFDFVKIVAHDIIKTICIALY